MNSTSLKLANISFLIVETLSPMAIEWECNEKKFSIVFKVLYASVRLN